MFQRHKIVQSGELVKDEFYPDRQVFMLMEYKYMGREFKMIDVYMNAMHYIISTLFYDGQVICQREYRIKDVFKPNNDKVPDPIYNLGAAKDCAALSSGECKVGADCYALRDEEMYKSPLLYRRRQEMFWRRMDAMQLAEFFLENRKGATRMRFDESGDFRTEDDVRKLNQIGLYMSYQGVELYTYTARRSFDWSALNRDHVTIIGSSLSGLDGQFIMSNDAKGDAAKMRKLGVKSIVCPADCYKCSVCPNMKKNPLIVFAQNHVNKKKTINHELFRAF